MSLPTSFLSESHLEKRKDRQEAKRLDKERSKYNPREHVRELNPFWKDGGDGLPKFKKPVEEENLQYRSKNRHHQTSSWRKKESDENNKHELYESKKLQIISNTKKEENFIETNQEVLSEKELNLLASKLVKAEIMGNKNLIKELKQKLEAAREICQRGPKMPQTEEVILTQSDSRGHVRPLRPQSDHQGEYSGGSKKKKQKVETHQDGQRVRYFANDDQQSLQQMFENEKLNTVEDQNSQFLKMASKIRKNDDLDEVFADNIRVKENESKIDARNRDKAINEHKTVAKTMDRCRFCLQSEVMQKHLLVSLGETVFLSLPPYEPLAEGHCWIVPIRHVSCATLLDENEWSEAMDFRKSLTRMFNSFDKDVIFFETAKNLDKYPHMYIECVPVDKEEGDLAPIYFKKAIDECEVEWAQNKKLVSLKNRDVRKAVPKGLPYFFVSFGMEEGFAHVIEDEKYFPNNFAPEVIGGMLDLHHEKWRKPKLQSFEEQSKRAVELSKLWADNNK